MPKMKTNKAASKRFRVTPSGKIRYVQSGLRHNLEHKSGKQKRAIGKPATISEDSHDTILRLLGRR
ncbi:MAG: 50S ribosomal protein L35 [Thermoleophilia bacterium]|jgi:large subunit ribosomal protein L35|nr:50S ribosomal protein L35 [Thermoleophilia bacterium]